MHLPSWVIAHQLETEGSLEDHAVSEVSSQASTPTRAPAEDRLEMPDTPDAAVSAMKRELVELREQLQVLAARPPGDIPNPPTDMTGPGERLPRRPQCTRC